MVAGSILFTPNAVIFDPDPKDPLVEELEPEAFQEIIQLWNIYTLILEFKFEEYYDLGNTVVKYLKIWP